MKGVTGLLLTGLAASLAWLAARNVFGEDPDTLEAARALACEGTVCTAELSWRKRTPWNQRMQFLVNESRPVEVLCRRPLVVHGASQCEIVHVDDR